MKIRALRLKSFRKFSGTFEISGLTDGLNVLAGDNETGKSTVFRALEAAFLTPHRVSGAALEAMRPYGGGDPYVDVDFDIAEGSWRMAKQFGRGKAAVLTDLKSGREVARAAEAEEQFSKLVRLSGEGAGRLGLVWVSQQRALRPPDPDIDPKDGKLKARGETNALVEAVGNEVETVAGGEATAAILQRVEEALAQLITPGREVPVKNGPLDAALKARDTAALELETANRAAAAAEHRLSDIGKLTTKLAVLDAPAERAEFESRVVALEARITREATTRADRDIALQAHKVMGLEAEAARKKHDDHEKLNAESSRLGKDQDAAQNKRQELAAQIADLRAANSKLEAGLAQCDAAIDKARGELSGHDQLASAKSTEARIKDLRAVDDAAHRIETDIQNLHATLASDLATPEQVRELEKLSNEIALIDAELNAAAAHVEFALDPQGVAKVRVDGQPAPASGRVAVPGHLDITIEGIGAIRVQAADAARLHERARRRSAAQASLSERLVAMAAASLDDAKSRAGAREVRNNELVEKRARLSGLAPQGHAALSNELQQLLGILASQPDVSQELKPRAEISQALDAAVLKRKETERQRLESVQHLNLCERNLAALEASSLARQARAADIAAVLPADQDRAAHLANLAGHASEKTLALETARQSLEALLAATLPDEKFRTLSSELAAAEQDAKQRAADVQRVHLELVGLKGEQSGSDADGKSGDVAGANDELERTKSEVARLEAEVAALRLLSRTLNGAEEKTRAQYFEPVTRRLVPYLARVIPEAQPSFSEGFTLQGLIRAGQREEFQALSDGTREQLSVLVRMAFARLIADSGEAAPLVLDDPLVYSDDTRLNSLCRALEDASAAHQIILLTCRATAFKDLAGHRLAITSWKPAN